MKSQGKDFLINHIYVDDIIFGGHSEVMCEEFESPRGSEF